jgi:hypothetical protein
MSYHRAGYPDHGRCPARSNFLAALGVAGALLLGGCAVGEGGMVEIMSPPAPASDSALAALSRGHIGDAEAWTTRALSENASDPYALLVRGMLAERAGQPAVAREAYGTILALAPKALIDLSPMDLDSSPRPVVEIAADRLDRLPPAPVAEGFARVPGVTGPRAMETPDTRMNVSQSGRDEAWQNLSSRFETLDRLYDQELITDMEYADRRRENLGALLPLTQTPPAAGLSRPAPRPTAVVGRLHDLGGTFERGAISASQHAEERRAILDALLPANPMTRETADMRPTSARDVSRHARRLADALQRGLITNEEYDRERLALRDIANQMSGGDAQAAMAAAPPTATAPTEGATTDGTVEDEASGTAPDGSAEPRPLLPISDQPGVTAGPPTANDEDPVTQRFSGVTGASSDGAPASEPVGNYVHLASYRTMDSAEAGWKALSERYAGSMRGMEPRYDPVTIPGKGDFVRLKAGPVQIPGGAARLCDRLRSAGQFCEPVAMDQ